MDIKIALTVPVVLGHIRMKYCCWHPTDKPVSYMPSDRPTGWEYPSEPRRKVEGLCGSPSAVQLCSPAELGHKQ